MKMGLGGILGIIFIVLRLVRVIDWSWVWVLSPFWISFVIVIVWATFIIVYRNQKYKRSRKHFGRNLKRAFIRGLTEGDKKE